MKSMKVLIDCTQIERKKAGVALYALNLVLELIKRKDSSAVLYLIVQDDDPDFDFTSKYVNVIKIPARYCRFLPLRLLMEQLYIPWLLHKYKINVMHSLHYSFPLLKTRAKKIVTVHDMTSFVMPEVHTRVKLAYFHLFIRAGSRLADALLFVSHSSKEDWLQYFPRSRKEMFVVHHGKAPEFRADLSETKITLAQQKYKLVTPYLLYVGVIEPRKNLTRLVLAYAKIADSFPAHSLVIAGRKGWMYEDLFDTVKSLSIESRIIFTGYIEEADKPFLIAGAAAFIYPSLYEGFGIPVLEAIACGTPTVTSDISSIPEVAGDAALLADPMNVDDIAAKLSSILSDESLRSSLRHKCVYQASLFSWERTAQETLDVYRTVARHLVE